MRVNRWWVAAGAAAMLAAPGVGSAQAPAPATAITAVDPAFNAIVSRDAKVETLRGDYFGIGEGPLWVREPAPGFLLFSDIAANVIYKWTPDGTLSVHLDKSGFTGTDTTNLGVANNGRLNVGTWGSNGLTLDPQGRLVLAAQGDRAIVRIEKDGTRTVLADRYEGQRLNSPNDLVVKKNGSVYFTDPPFGLRGGPKSPARELQFSGVFLIRDGKVTLLEREIPVPNGIVLSGDEKYLYVGGGGIRRYEVQADDTVASPMPFFQEGCDGLKLDQAGNVYCVNRGALWVLSPAGKHLGTITTPDNATNFAFGDADARTIYITTRRGLYKVRSNVAGVRP
jgi:gluconolactonase